jgi:hypothetical protein
MRILAEVLLLKPVFDELQVLVLSHPEMMARGHMRLSK